MHGPAHWPPPGGGRLRQGGFVGIHGKSLGFVGMHMDSKVLMGMHGIAHGLPLGGGLQRREGCIGIHREAWEVMGGSPGFVGIRRDAWVCTRAATWRWEAAAGGGHGDTWGCMGMHGRTRAAAWLRVAVAGGIRRDA